MWETIAFTLLIGGWFLGVIYVSHNRSEAFGLDRAESPKPTPPLNVFGTLSHVVAPTLPPDRSHHGDRIEA